MLRRTVAKDRVLEDLVPGNRHPQEKEPLWFRLGSVPGTRKYPQFGDRLEGQNQAIHAGLENHPLVSALE